jgi:hypothetical protein
LHARQVISGNQWYLHDGELADALDRHRLFEGGGVESKQLGSVVEAGLCSAAHLMREAISMQSSRSSAASGFAIRMQSACSAAYGAAVILLSELHGLEGQVADVQYLWGKGAVVSTCMLSEHADRRCHLDSDATGSSARISLDLCQYCIGIRGIHGDGS